MNQMYKQAQRYIKEFNWSVIPIRPDGSKAPALGKGEVEQYRQRYATDQELEQWFVKQNNWLGIVAGKLSNLSILDDDSGAIGDLVSSPLIQKTRKGRHLFFKYNEKLKNLVKPDNAGYDFRTEGGYVVASPTPNYRWINPYFTRGTVDGLPEFPLHLIPAKQEKKRNAPGYIAELLKNLKEGNRDASFTSIIGRLHADRYDAATIALFLAPYAESSGFGILALEQKIDHIINDYPHPADPESDDISDFLEDIAPVNWLVPGIIPCSSLGFTAGLPETFKTWLMADLAIELARGGKWINKFHTNPAKVLFIDQERHKTETQRRFKGLFSAKGIYPKSMNGRLFVRSGTTTRIDLEDSYKAFRKRLEEIRPDIVIVDSWATFQTSDDNDRSTTQKVLERIKQLRQDFSCAFLFIDHENKSVYTAMENKEPPNAFRMVGSVGKVAAAEVVLTVRKYAPEMCMVYVTKSTMAPAIESFPITVKDVTNGIVVTSEGIENE